MISLRKIAKWLKIQDIPHLPISTFVQDSRLAKKGSCFFALSGEKTDGIKYLADVAKQGAFAAVVPKDYQGDDFGLILLKVDDVLEAMQHIAKEALKERATKVIGVTGSVGKTTTRHFLTQLLSLKYKVGYPPQNYNSQRTMPLVILNADGDEDFLVLEMAMDLPNEIKKLVQIAPTDYAILTAVTLAHYFDKDSPFKSLDEVAKHKAMIFCEKTEFGVVHQESALFKEVQEAVLCETAVYPTPLDFEFPFKETHLCEGLSAAIEMALYLGVSEKKIRKALPGIKTFERRFQKIKRDGITFINDTYNASPISVVAALKNLPETKKGRKIAVLGTMGGLGEFSRGAHLQVGREALKHVDEVLCIGEECKPIVDLFKREGKKATLFADKEAIKKALKEVSDEDDVVLLKGSNYLKLWELIEV